MTNILARIKSLGYAAAVTSGINKLNVLMHDKLTSMARSLRCMQRARVIDPANVAIALIAYTGGNGNCHSEGFSLASFMAYAQKNFSFQVTRRAFHNFLEKEGFLLLMHSVLRRLSACVHDSFSHTANELIYVFSTAVAIADICEVDGCELRVIPSCHQLFKCKAKTKAKYFVDEKPAGIKIHFGYSPISSKPIFAVITEAIGNEKEFVTSFANTDPKKRTLYLCDKGYVSEKLWGSIHGMGHYFVIKGKENMAATVLSAHDRHGNRLPELEGKRVNVKLSSKYDLVDYMVQTSKGNVVRVVRAYSKKAKKYVFFVTNIEQNDIHGDIIADVYRIRWQQEIFHKALKSFNGLQTLNTRHPGKILLFIIASICSYLLKLIIGQHISKKSKSTSEKSILRIQQYVPCSMKLLKGMLKGSRHMIYDSLNEIARDVGQFIYRYAPSKRDMLQGKDMPVLTKKIRETYRSTRGQLIQNPISISFS